MGDCAESLRWCEGLTICATGLSKDCRGRLAKRVADLGGRYSAALRRGCTHLLVCESIEKGERSSQKLCHALKVHKRLKLVIVKFCWWELSCRKGSRLPEEEFSIGLEHRNLTVKGLQRSHAGCGVPTPPRCSGEGTCRAATLVSATTLRPDTFSRPPMLRAPGESLRDPCVMAKSSPRMASASCMDRAIWLGMEKVKKQEGGVPKDGLDACKPSAAAVEKSPHRLPANGTGAKGATDSGPAERVRELARVLGSMQRHCQDLPKTTKRSNQGVAAGTDFADVNGGAADKINPGSVTQGPPKMDLNREPVEDTANGSPGTTVDRCGLSTADLLEALRRKKDGQTRMPAASQVDGEGQRRAGGVAQAMSAGGGAAGRKASLDRGDMEESDSGCHGREASPPGSEPGAFCGSWSRNAEGSGMQSELRPLSAPQFGSASGRPDSADASERGGPRRHILGDTWGGEQVGTPADCPKGAEDITFGNGAPAHGETTSDRDEAAGISAFLPEDRDGLANLLQKLKARSAVVKPWDRDRPEGHQWLPEQDASHVPGGRGSEAESTLHREKRSGTAESLADALARVKRSRLHETSDGGGVSAHKCGSPAAETNGERAPVLGGLHREKSGLSLPLDGCDPSTNPGAPNGTSADVGEGTVADSQPRGSVRHPPQQHGSAVGARGADAFAKDGISSTGASDITSLVQALNASRSRGKAFPQPPCPPQDKGPGQSRSEACDAKTHSQASTSCEGLHRGSTPAAPAPLPQQSILRSTDQRDGTGCAPEIASPAAAVREGCPAMVPGAGPVAGASEPPPPSLKSYGPVSEPIAWGSQQKGHPEVLFDPSSGALPRPTSAGDKHMAVVEVQELKGACSRSSKGPPDVPGAEFSFGRPKSPQSRSPLVEHGSPREDSATVQWNAHTGAVGAELPHECGSQASFEFAAQPSPLPPGSCVGDETPTMRAKSRVSGAPYLEPGTEGVGRMPPVGSAADGTNSAVVPRCDDPATPEPIGHLLHTSSDDQHKTAANHPGKRPGADEMVPDTPGMDMVSPLPCSLGRIAARAMEGATAPDSERSNSSAGSSRLLQSMGSQKPLGSLSFSASQDSAAPGTKLRFTPFSGPEAIAAGANGAGRQQPGERAACGEETPASSVGFELRRRPSNGRKDSLNRRSDPHDRPPSASSRQTPGDAPKAVFHGVAAFVDPCLDEATATKVREALCRGGGSEAPGAYLGSGATHVVCPPQGAAGWMSCGLHVVSPDWVIRSAASGRTQRCVQMSVDVQRLLPSGAEAGPAEDARREPAEAGPEGPDGLEALRQSREAREALLRDCLEAKDTRQKTLSMRTRTPTHLLDVTEWCVSEQPSAETFSAEEVVYRAASITLLYPQDRKGALGKISRTYEVEWHGLTPLRLAQIIFGFYAEELELAQHVQAMKSMKQSSRCGKMLRQAFMDLRPVQRSELLDTMRCCDSVVKVSNDPDGTIYELKLEG